MVQTINMKPDHMRVSSLDLTISPAKCHRRIAPGTTAHRFWTLESPWLMDGRQMKGLEPSLV